MPTNHRKFWMKSATSVVGLALFLSAGFGMPHRAHALFGVGDVVIDPTNLVQNTITAVQTATSLTKDYVLDTLAWQIGNIAVQSMTKSIVNWINSGFDGSPAFVTDLNQNLRGVGDTVAAQFFNELSNQSIATTPFQDRVLDAVRLGYYLHTSPESFYTRYPYTLNQVSANDRAFLAGDFSQGGWNAWFATVMNPQNNPYGAQMLADEALQNAVSSATGNRLEELSWNRGFLSWRGECTAERDPNAPVPLGDVDNCLSYEIRTPGSVIMESLNKVQGVPFDRLVSADEFNEIIGALLNQLALQVLGGGDGGGVRGLSQPSTGGGGTYFDRTDSTDTGNTPSIAAAFTNTLADQRQRLVTFQTAWERIRNAAETAGQRCSANPTVADTRAQASAMLVKAANGIAAISGLEARIANARAAGGNQSVAIAEIAQEYSDLSNSGALPTAQEIAEALVESEDTGDVEPGSLYSQMVRIASSVTCRSAD